MSFKGKICSLGVWDETIPGIKFDENGVSNYAKLFDTLIEAFPRGEKGQKDWNSIVDRIKKDGKNKKYDCIIGISGGTDSSYLLHLAKEYGLKPLAVNLDNGWGSDISVKNIKKMTTALNIDLETYVIDYEEVKDLLRTYIYANMAWIDTPTDLAIKSILYKIASRENIKYVLRGNDFYSEGSQPNEWTQGDGKQLKFLHKKFGRVKLKTFPNYTIYNLFYYSFIKKIKSIYPFYYLNYNKSDAQSFLIENYNWEYYGGHHFENIFTKFALSYWMYEKFGIDKRKISYSAQVMNNQISREEAIKIIEQKPYDVERIEHDKAYIIKKLDLTNDEFDKCFKGENKNYYDYPSYDKLFKFALRFAKPIFKLFFIHKPQSLYQEEMRKQSN